MINRFGSKHWLSVAILGLGTALYAVLVGAAGITFFITPLFVGGIAVLAGLVGADRHLVPAGLPLMGWGIAALLGNESVISESRITASYMVGITAGIVLAWVVAPAASRELWVSSAAISALVGSTGYLLEYNFSWLGKWPAWCVALGLWALWEVVAPNGEEGRF